MLSPKWIQFVTFLLAIIISVKGSTDRWDELLVKYQPTFVGAGISGFWSVPRTYTAALFGGWVPVANALPNLGVQSVASSASDLAFTPLYRLNRLVGFNLAIPVQDAYESGPHEILPARQGAANEIVWLRDTYYLQSSALFVAPAQLRLGRLAASDGLWLRNTSDPAGYTMVPTVLGELEDTTPYRKQGCMPSMGTHYYYNMSAESSCEEFPSWSLLGDNGTVFGVAWQIFGKPRVYGRDWYDAIPSAQVPSHAAALRGTAPAAPACLHRNAERYGLISMHLYFVPDPWTINCSG